MNNILKCLCLASLLLLGANSSALHAQQATAAVEEEIPQDDEIPADEESVEEATSLASSASASTGNAAPAFPELLPVYKQSG